MTKLFLLLVLTLGLSGTKSIYDFTMKDIDGKDISLNNYKGKVVVIINVASKCGYTPQYKEIQQFYEKYSSKGVVVLGFPCNQFMGQEPGSESDIKTFCTNQYHVTFPMFSKIDVKGSNQSPLYTYLTEEAQNGVESNKVAWNFQKFIIGKNGKLIKSYSPPTSVFDPEFIKAIELALN